MYVIVTGGGKVGSNVTRTLLGMGHEVTLIEQRRDRFERLEAEFGHVPVLGDATEIFVLEAAGVARPPEILFAVTGDDEDNLVISQIAREGYGVPKVIARVNDPRNEPHFDLLGISPTVSATSMVLALVEHEVPQHELVHLLEHEDLRPVAVDRAVLELLLEPLVAPSFLLDEDELVPKGEKRSRDADADLASADDDHEHQLPPAERTLSLSSAMAVLVGETTLKPRPE